MPSRGFKLVALPIPLTEWLEVLKEDPKDSYSDVIKAHVGFISWDDCVNGKRIKGAIRMRRRQKVRK